uniref:unspecific monooxygenase n=1 Tax=Seriola dumerili TaxID=41447 RepID=A0A3B4UV85_SERDU
MGFLPFFSLETWILLITFICIFVMNGYWTYGVFEKLGIPGPKPFMYFGSICRFNPVYYLDDLECAKKYGKVWGTYELKMPMLVVMDPDMLKTILVKECFTYFTNRRIETIYIFIFTFILLRFILLSLPLFKMFSIMKHHSRKLTDKLQSRLGNDDVIVVKDFFGPYSMDVMASCAFNVDMDSINNPSSPLITHGSKLFRISISLFLFQGFFPIFLPLLKLLGFSLFPKTSTAFFKAIVEKIRAERIGSSHQNSGDILQHMIDSQTVNEPRKEEQNKGLTDHEIVSQATMFVFAGYETSATTLVFLVYTLARNPEVMKRLQKEIDSTFPNKGPVQYEALMQMEYLDSVVNECLRLYPPAARIEREAKETVKINGVTIPKNITVMIPVYALHHDPELWPEPEEFKPDRFSKENKQSINPYTYLPFGVGPRNCIGMRFALVMTKLALVEVLQNYSFSVCKETEIPLQMDPQGLLGPLRPIKLKLEKRSTTSENVDN